MGNSLRCCLACVLPCGAFDLIRIVHLNGRIEEYGRSITAGEVLAAHPNHILSRPCSQGGARRILIISPDSELKRGHFYFLVPEKKRKQQKRTRSARSDVASANDVANGDSYLADILSENKSSYCHSKSARRTRVWRPHLQSILEET